MSKYAGRIQTYVNIESIDSVDTVAYDIVQPKHDGWWARVVIDGKSAAIYSRQSQLKTRKPVGRDCPKMTLIGEYVFGTNRASGAESRYEEMVVAFDIVELNGKVIAETLPYARRLDIVEHVAEHADWIVPVVSEPVGRAKAMWQSSVLRGGCEGLVFRNSSHAYSDAVVGRLKRQFTLDYVVMGFEEGKGKLKGMTGVLVCGQYQQGRLVELCRVGGGMSNDLRRSIWSNQRLWRGRVIEVKGWQVFDTGALRHPQFVRVRDDKKATDCVWKGGKS